MRAFTFVELHNKQLVEVEQLIARSQGWISLFRYLETPQMCHQNVRHSLAVELIVILVYDPLISPSGILIVGLLELAPGNA